MSTSSFITLRKRAHAHMSMSNFLGLCCRWYQQTDNGNYISLANQPLPFLKIGRRGESGHNRHCRMYCWTAIAVSKTLLPIVSWLWHESPERLVYAVGKTHFLTQCASSTMNATNLFWYSSTSSSSSTFQDWYKGTGSTLLRSYHVPLFDQHMLADSPFVRKEVTWSCIKDNSGEITRTIDGSPLPIMSKVHGRQA